MASAASNKKGCPETLEILPRSQTRSHPLVYNVRGTTFDHATFSKELTGSRGKRVPVPEIRERAQVWCYFFRNPKTRRYTLAALLFICSPCFSRLWAQDVPSGPDLLPKPSARIELSDLGYRGPSRSDRLVEDEPNVSLNFVDTNHLLLTFNPRKLFQRLPGCPPEHQDRLVHAVVLEVPSGKVVHEADWYLHDRRRYLWPLGPGKFLLRKLNDLYLVDPALHENLLMSSPKDLLWVSVTPDGSQIVVETASDTRDSKTEQTSAAKPKPKFVAQFLDAKTLAPQRTIPLNEVVDLNGASAGYVDLVHKGEIWLVRFGSTAAKRRNLARVRSRTVPSVLYTSNNSVLIGRCASSNCDYSVTAFTTAGRRLWRQHWSRYRFFASVAHSEDGSRFAVSTARLAAPVASTVTSHIDPDDQDSSQPTPSQQEVFQQEIQIIETASGTSVASVDVSAAVLSGQNFSLSLDGRRLAVLQDAGVELFDLPPPSESERAKFSALQTDVPNLYALASDEDSVPPPSADAVPDNDPADAAAAAADPAPSATEGKPGASASTADPDHAAASPATNAPTATTPVPTFKVSTKAVTVDVVVTDSKGHPIRGLPQQDFKLEEDGKLQDIRYFREFTDPDTRAAAATAAVTAPVPSPPPQLSPNVFSNDTHAPDPGAVTLVLLDLLNTPTADQVYARQQLIKFLQSKPKYAEFALCTMSAGESRLRLIQGFTPNETLLLAAAKGKKGRPQGVTWQESATATANAVSDTAQLAQGGPTSGFQNLLGALQNVQAHEQIADADERVAVTVDSMMQLARYLSGIPGRKNVIWLSGSFPITLATTANLNDPTLENRNYSNLIKHATNLLADAQIAVYPVDVRGLVGGGIAAAGSTGSMGGSTYVDQADFSATAVTSGSIGGGAPSDLQALAQSATERNSLIQIAAATGGKAFYNSNGIRDAIATASEQGSNYYTLSYTPANKVYDGKFRKLKVLLPEKYTLHYRQGYFADATYDATKDADLARRTRAVAMQHASPPSRQILFSVTVGTMGGKKKIDRSVLGNALVPAKVRDPSAPIEVQHYMIDYTLQGSALRFTPLANASYRNVLTLMVTSFDREGRMLTAVSSVGASELQPAAYNQVITGKFGVRQEVDVPAEAASLRLGIQDQMSNHLGTVDIPLPVPPLPAQPRRSPMPDIEPD
jgi:VWFA-related protein